MLLVKTKFCFSFLIVQSMYKQVRAGENWALHFFFVLFLTHASILFFLFFLFSFFPCIAVLVLVGQIREVEFRETMSMTFPILAGKLLQVLH